MSHQKALFQEVLKIKEVSLGQASQYLVPSQMAICDLQ